MPFKSLAQQKWMYANKPELAKQFESETPSGVKLPNRVGAKSASEKRQLARQRRTQKKNNERFGKIAKKLVKNKFKIVYLLFVHHKTVKTKRTTLPNAFAQI